MDGYDKTLTEKLEKARMRLQTKRCQTWELAERVRKACKTSVVCFSLPEATLAARNTAHRKLSLNCWWSNCIVGRCSSFGNTHTNPLPNKHSVERDCVFPQSHFCILSLLLWFCPLLHRLSCRHISRSRQVQIYGGLIFHTQAVYGLLLLFMQQY